MSLKGENMHVLRDFLPFRYKIINDFFKRIFLLLEKKS